MTILVIILVALSLGVAAFYMWGMRYIRKQKQKLWLYAPPFILNTIGVFFTFYIFLMIMVAFAHEIPVEFSAWLMLFTPLIFQTIANQLLYFLYYKKKKKMNAKEYALTSLAGALSIIIYMAYLEVNKYVRLLSMLPS